MRWLRLCPVVQFLLLALIGFASAVRAPAADCFSIPSGLAGWWPGDGNANNLLGTNNGTLSGGATASAAGFNGQAFTFNGVSAYVSIPDSPALKPTNLTVEAWVRFSSLDSTGSGPAQGAQYIVFKQNTRSASFEGFDLGKTRVAGNDVFRFIVSSAAGQSVSIQSSTLVSTGVWYHVAGVRGSNFVQLYVNGALERQTNVTFAQDYGNFPLYFGSSGQSWDRKFAGSLDEVALYSRAMSSNEIASVYVAGAAGKCKAPNITVQPQSQTVPAGTNAQFTVAATGFGALNYQWRFSGTNLSGATATNLTLANVQSNNAGNYTVIVINTLGSATSAVAVLTVAVPPGISVGPQSTTNNQGANVTFNVIATGTAPLSYQWRFNSANIGGATGSSYTRSNAQPADAGNYSVVVTNVAGAITSSVASLTINVPPGISAGPQSTTNNQGSDVTFSVTATGTAPLSYQWRFGAANISGATGSSYTRSNAQPADAGNYSVVVTNVAGAITSSVASLTINVPPGISVGPQNSTNSQGADVTFSVTATGTAPLSYQWQFNSANIGGATGSSYTRSNAQPADAGDYTVVVTNVAGSITSSVASLTVNVPPGISVGPQSSTNNQGADVTFNVTATGTAPLSYQWQFNSANIGGATGSSYTRSNAQPADAGNYSVVVTNVAGSITSSVASLTVNVPPGISVGPQSSTNNQGADVTFNVTATGTAPLSYQWQFNSANIGGATGSSYTRSNAQPADAGDYTVVVTNVAGAITSSVASLTINVPPGISVGPQNSTNNQGSDVTFNVTATGTAPLSYQWRFGAANIGGATGSSYTRSNAQPADAGSYTVVVTNVAGAITSSVASLTINVPPGISAGPQSSTHNQGANVTFNVIATGTAPLSYQWRFGAANIGGATGSSYTRSNAQPADAGNYSVVVTNMAGAITSSVASLTVLEGQVGRLFRVTKDSTGDFPAIQACVNALLPGDTCLVSPGTYNERIIFPPIISGAPGSNLVIKAETQGTVNMLGFDTLNASYLRIEGFNITAPTNSTYTSGVLVRSSYVQVVSNSFSQMKGSAISGSGNNSDHIYVAGNKIYKPGFGIIAAGHYWTVEGNEIEGVVKYPNNGDADYVRFFGTYHTFRDNYFHDADSSELVGAHTDAFQSFDNNGLSAQHIRIEGNRLIGYLDEGIILEGMIYTNSFDVVVCNNIFRNVSAWGVLIKRVHDVKVYNNVFVRMNIYGVGFTEQSSGETVNNIFYRGTSTDYFSDNTSTNKGGTNILFRFTESLDPTNFPNDLVNVNPLFVDGTNNNFYLQPGSPAINGGLALTHFTTDIAGTTRPQGPRWDIGPFEYLAGNPDTNPPVISGVTVSGVTLQQAVITWTTDENANRSVSYGTTTNYGDSLSTSFDIMTKSHSFTLTNLTPATVYHFQVRSTDLAGNSRASADLSFATAAIDTNVPEVTLTAPPDWTTVSGSLTLNAEATDDPGGSGIASVSFLVDDVVVGCASNAPYSLSWDSRWVTNGNHLLTARAEDAQGNVGISSNVILDVRNVGQTTSGLVGYWTFDGRKENIVPDMSGNANDAFLVLSPPLSPGKIRNALELTELNDYARVPSSPSLEIAGNAISVCAWVRLAPMLEPQTILGKVVQEGSSEYPYCTYLLQVLDNGSGSLRPQFAVTTTDGNLQYVNAAATFGYYQWHHLAGVYDGVDLRIYIDGVESDYRSAEGNIKSNNQPLFIGGDSISTGSAKGLIDDVRVYNRALAVDEVLNLSKAQKPGRPAGIRVTTASGPST